MKKLTKAEYTLLSRLVSSTVSSSKERATGVLERERARAESIMTKINQLQ